MELSLDDLDMIVAEGLGNALPTLQRELGDDDISRLALPLPIDAPGQRLGRIRHGHHALARLLAEGRKAVEISAITGYSQSRISILQTDPAFAELVSYYQAQVGEVFLDAQEVLKNLAITAASELQERLEENPERLATKEVLAIMDSAMDRGLAPNRSAKGTIGGPSGASPINFTVTFVKPQEQSTLLEAQVIDITPRDAQDS